MTTLPFATESTDTVVYGCKGCVYVSLYVCSYVSSAVKISTVDSPRDKASIDIVPPRVGWLSLPLSSPYRALWTYEDNSQVHHEQAVLQDHT